PAAENGDQLQCTGEGGRGDAATAEALADEAAGDAPVGRCRHARFICGPVLDLGYLVGGAELAPAQALISSKTSAAWAVPALTRARLRRRFTPATFRFTSSGRNPMHQQPPKMPLLRSTSSAKAGHVDSSSALTL